ncbi:peptidoglycan DD-metalloendopeptidase family protein [Paenibacillus sp. Leaf72]|uniref:peptidoglycan DD-metalloendopeptidase family protein n=1 Tax=Paenibacillus sp. Leaf72 TaxID=1736234 RepID=UPI0006F4462A|nr:peptidoglycan DD-metalloendopeptidase family protein [Paenibacillus sp. Leaf72]KQN97033.1 hypothetical protein ASF12_23475 [Paenibacillus sp. Leaf72]
MDFESLIKNGANGVKTIGKQLIKQLVKQAGKKIVAKVITVAGPYIAIALVVLLLVVCIWAMFFSVPKEYEQEEGQLAFFTVDSSDPEWNLGNDRELQVKYDELSNNGIDSPKDMRFGSKNAVPYQMSPFDQAKIYKVSWALLAGADRVLGDPILGDGKTRNPNPEKIYKAIGPRYKWKDSTVTVKTCTTTSEGTSCSSVTYETDLITSVDQYNKTMTISYKTEITSSGSDNSQTTIEREIVDKIVSTPRTVDRLTTYLSSNGLINEDTDFVVELAKTYDPSFVDIPFGSEGGHFGNSEYVSAQVPAEFLPIYQAAEAKYGVPWFALAAIHRVETRFSTDPTMISSVGAIGHMQFMPATWVGWKYNVGGGLVSSDIDITDLVTIFDGGGYGQDANNDGKADPWDIQDAIFSAAYFLASNNYNADPRKAIYQYNHANWYVEEVLSYIELFQKPKPKWEEAVYPVEPGKYRVSSPFDIRQDPFTGETKSHKGIDLAAPEGTPVRSPIDGIVAFVGVKGGYGNCIIIDHGNGIQTLYGHLQNSSFLVKTKQKVTTGQQIAGVGSTGRSTGNHLHFEVHIDGTAVDPAQYFSF